MGTAGGRAHVSRVFDSNGRAFGMNRRPGSATPRPRVRQVGRYRLDHQLLGKGNFARVELATHTILGLKVAVKMIDKAQITEDYVRRNLGREARIMSRLRHPHIAALYEAIESGHLVCLVTELAPGGDLCSHVKAQVDGRLHEAAARPFLRQIVSALTYMHGRGVIHRDLKMENVMLDETKSQVKIVDFGLSNFYGPGVTLQTHCGSPEYAAPELFVPGRPYGPEVDVWSLGVIMYGALTGCLPFLSPRTDGANPQERRHRLYRKIQQGLGQHHWKALSNISPECRDLLLSLLTANPEKRISLECVQVHPYITAGGCCPVNECLQLGLEHPDVQKVFSRLSELLKVPVEVVEGEIERDDHCDVAAMFYLLLAALRRCQSIDDSCYETANESFQSELIDSDQSLVDVVTPESAPFLPMEQGQEGQLSESPASPVLSDEVAEERTEKGNDGRDSPLLGGAGEAETSQSAVGEDAKMVNSGTAAVASGDGIVIDGRRSRSQQVRSEEPVPTRVGTARRLNLRHLCFKGQTSDASLTSHLLLEKHPEQRRRQKRDDEDGEGKRRPKTGDSCFCMLNYANQWDVLTDPHWKWTDKPRKGPSGWQYIVKTTHPLMVPLGRKRDLVMVMTKGKGFPFALLTPVQWLPLLSMVLPMTGLRNQRCRAKKLWGRCTDRFQRLFGGSSSNGRGCERRRRRRKKRRRRRSG